MSLYIIFSLYVIYIMGVMGQIFSSEELWDKKSIHLFSDLVQPKVIILFGLNNQKIIPKVYKKIKKYEILSRIMYKKR
nr:ribosomal protein L22 [Polygala tenuifolia]